MMLLQISLGILIISFLVLAVILIKKGPYLVAIEVPVKKRESFLSLFRKKIMDIPFIRNFSWNRILQKILSKTRILILKIEGKIGEQLHFLRKMSNRKKK